jgi:hypothetical protein
MGPPFGGNGADRNQTVAPAVGAATGVNVSPHLPEIRRLITTRNLVSPDHR